MQRRINEWPALKADTQGKGKGQEMLFPLHSENPGISLVGNKLNKKNFFSWKRSVMIALRAKTKLGYIDGSIMPPDEDNEEFENWKNNDAMVLAWLLNSLSAEIVDSFLYAETAKELWDEIVLRYGESNGPMQYNIEREIATISQLSDSVVDYFGRIKKLWDEYMCVAPYGLCDCERNDRNEARRLIQFLMGLNDSYEQVRSQIMLMEPLPSVNKAYSMVLKIEKQRETHNLITEQSDSLVMNVRNTTMQKSFTGRNYFSRGGRTGFINQGRGRGLNRRIKEEREQLYCEHCQLSGHDKSGCFKIHGYPEWYLKMQEDRKKNFASQTEYIQESRIKEQGNSNTSSSSDITSIVQQEVMRILYAKINLNEPTEKCEPVNAVSFSACGEPPLLLSASVHCATRAAIVEARKQLKRWGGLRGTDSEFLLKAPATLPVVAQLCGLNYVEKYLQSLLSSS